MNDNIHAHTSFTDTLDTDSWMHYDILLTTQVFAALTVRKELQYEMQCHFNEYREVCVNSLVQYTKLLHAQHRHTSLERLSEKLIQIRIAHMLHIHYMYSALSLFITNTIALNKTDPSIKEILHMRDNAHIYIMFLRSLDSIVTQMAEKFTDYVHALALIHLVNTQSININTLQQENIAQMAVTYIVNDCARECVTQQVILKPYNQQTLMDIVTKMLPLRHDNTQLVQYLHTQVLQILNCLHSTRFQQWKQHVRLPLIQTCYKALSAKETETTYKCVEQNSKLNSSTHNNTQTLLVHGVCNSFKILYEHCNAIYVMQLSLQYMAQQYYSSVAYMNNDLLAMFKPISQEQDMRILTESLFASQTCRPYVFFVLTNSIMRKIYNHCVKKITMYSQYTLTIISAVFTISSAQFILHTLQLF